MTTLNIIMEGDVTVNGSDPGMDTNINTLHNMNGHDDINCASKNKNVSLENTEFEKNKSILEDTIGKNVANVSPSMTGKSVLKQIDEGLEDEAYGNVKVYSQKLIRKSALKYKQNEKMMEVGLDTNVIFNVSLKKKVGKGKQIEEGLEDKLKKTISKVSPKKSFGKTELKTNKDGLEGEWGDNVSTSQNFEKTLLEENKVGLEDGLNKTVSVSPNKLIEKTDFELSTGGLEGELGNNVVSVAPSKISEKIIEQSAVRLSEELDKNVTVSLKKMADAGVQQKKLCLESELGANDNNYFPLKIGKGIHKQNERGLEDKLKKNISKVSPKKSFGKAANKTNRDGLEGELDNNVVNVAPSKMPKKIIIKQSVERLLDESDKNVAVSPKKMADTDLQQEKLYLEGELAANVNIDFPSKKVGKIILKQNEVGLKDKSTRNFVNISPKKLFGITAPQENKDGSDVELENAVNVSSNKKYEKTVFKPNLSSVIYSSQRISGRCALRQTPTYDRYGIRSKLSFSPSSYKRKSDDLNFNENKRFAHDSSSSLTVNTPTWKYVASPFTRLWSPRPSTSYSHHTSLNDSLHVNYDDTNIQDITEESDLDLVEKGTSEETKTSVTKKSVTQSWCALM